MGIIDNLKKVFRGDTSTFSSVWGYGKKKDTEKRDPMAKQTVRKPAELTPEQHYNIYRSSELGGKVVDDLSEDMVRSWFDIESESSSLSDDIQGKLNDLDAQPKLQDMVKWELVFGDGYVSTGINGDAEPTNEVNNVDDISYLHSFSRFKTKDQVRNENVLSEDYGDFEKYTIKVPDGDVGTRDQDVHSDRILHLQMRPRLDSKWGDSIFTRMRRILIVFDNTIWTLGQIIFQMMFKTLKTNLNKKSDADVEAISEEMEQEMNALSLWLLHKDEKNEEKLEIPSSTMNISGFSDVADFLKNMAAVSIREPESFVFGAQAGTLSASDVDSLNHYKRVNGLQETYLRPILEKLVGYVVQSLDAENEDYEIKFNDLYTYDDKTQAEVRLTKAKAHEKEINTGILTAQEIRSEEYDKDRIDLSPPE